VTGREDIIVGDSRGSVNRDTSLHQSGEMKSFSDDCWTRFNYPQWEEKLCENIAIIHDTRVITDFNYTEYLISTALLLVDKSFLFEGKSVVVSWKIVV